MRSTRLGLVGMVAALGCSVPAQAEEAGITLTLSVPESFSAGRSFAVSGYLVAHARAPVFFEYATGLAGQRVEIVVDGVVTASALTDASGLYTANLTFGPAPLTRLVTARAFSGTPIEENSAPSKTSLDLVLTSLEIRPSGNVALAAGGSVQLQAWAEDTNGRSFDVTRQAVWSSGDETVAIASNDPGSEGRVSGVAPGSTTITASVQGLTASRQVTVS